MAKKPDDAAPKASAPKSDAKPAVAKKDLPPGVENHKDGGGDGIPGDGKRGKNPWN